MNEKAGKKRAYKRERDLYLPVKTWLDAQGYDVHVERIVPERLDRWGKKMIAEHTTPVLLVGIGHDERIGTIAVHITEDMPESLAKELVTFLYRSVVLGLPYDYRVLNFPFFHFSVGGFCMELLPCPFCGKTPQLSSFYRTGYGVGGQVWRIKCPDVECFAEGPGADSVEKAAERWNARSVNSDWRIGLSTRPYLHTDPLYYDSGIIRDVLPSGAGGLVDKHGILKIELFGGVTVLRRASDWRFY